MKRLFVLLVATLLMAGCGGPPSGPPSTQTSSSQFTTITEKIAFLEKYVMFRRAYVNLDYQISYHNNSGGGVPGPSDWDIRIVAQVPAAELKLWTSGLKPAAAVSTNWLADVSTTIYYSGISSWFQSGHITVGVDKNKSVVVYRNRTQ